MIKFVLKSLLLTQSLFLLNVARAADKTKVWWYTSVYKEYATPIEKMFEQKNPKFDVEIFQAGSEKLLTKIEAELKAKKVQADVLSVSDAFYLNDLDKRGLLLKRDKVSSVRTNYYSVMVLITHKSQPKDKRPSSFADLAKPEFKSIVQMGSPLESGSQFSVVAYLQKTLGWSYFQKLRDNQIAANGGNSTVIQKVESGEKKIGVVLLENALASIKRGSPIEIIYPSEGSFPIPSVQGIFASTPNKEGASAFADFLLSKDGQSILRGGYMYSIDKSVPAPDSAKPLSEIVKGAPEWTPEFINEVNSQSKDIKKKFAQMILE